MKIKVDIEHRVVSRSIELEVPFYRKEEEFFDDSSGYDLFIKAISETQYISVKKNDQPSRID